MIPSPTIIDIVKGLQEHERFATRGPWTVDSPIRTDRIKACSATVADVRFKNGHNDANLIVALRNAFPVLGSVLLEREEEFAELDHLVKEAWSFADDGSVSLRQRVNICQRNLAQMRFILSRQPASSDS